MIIDKVVLSKMLLFSSERLKEESKYLSEIDSKFGDGDHGVTIHKIALLIEKKVKEWGEESIHDFIESLGTDIMAVNGGSAGPLYGTMIGGLATPLNEEKVIDSALLKTMLQSMLDEMQEITTAKIGDKTMMDALIPAVNAGVETDGDVLRVLEASATAAKKGAEKSKEFASKFGRAKSYKEQTIGTPDAGAVSTSIFFQAIYEGIK